MKKIKIIALFGKSGSGKDTVKTWILNHMSNTKRIVSMTTRPPREGEIDGINYIFTTPENFENHILANDMLEATFFRGWNYGTPISSLDPDKINIGIFNPAGLAAILEDERLDVCPIYIHASDKERLIRSLNREENPDCAEICRRFSTDEKDFGNMTCLNNYPFLTFENKNDIISKDNTFELFKFMSNQNILAFVTGQLWTKCNY